MNQPFKESGTHPAKAIACRLCGKPTPMLGTQLCDPCWELEGRIKRDPELARKILAKLVDDTRQATAKVLNTPGLIVSAVTTADDDDARYIHFLVSGMGVSAALQLGHIAPAISLVDKMLATEQTRQGKSGVQETPLTKHAREVMDFVGRRLHLTPEEREKHL